MVQRTWSLMSTSSESFQHLCLTSPFAPPSLPITLSFFHSCQRAPTHQGHIITPFTLNKKTLTSGFRLFCECVQSALNPALNVSAVVKNIYLLQCWSPLMETHHLGGHASFSLLFRWDDMTVVEVKGTWTEFERHTEVKYILKGTPLITSAWLVLNRDEKEVRCVTPEQLPLSVPGKNYVSNWIEGFKK